MTLADLIPSLRTSLAATLPADLWPSSARASCAGELTIGGVPLSHLAARHGTPCRVIDLDDVRLRCREYRQTLPGAEIAYCASALPCSALTRLVTREGLSLAVRSVGELEMARAAGCPAPRLVLHGEAKTVEELKLALNIGVGRIVVDCLDDIDQLGALAVNRAPRRQRVLLRVETDRTGDRPPFGFPSDDGSALNAAGRILRHPQLRLAGLHTHLGSHLCSVARYERSARALVGLLAELRQRWGVQLGQLNLGGGHAIRYRDGDDALNLVSWANRVPDTVRAACREHRVATPRLTVEPGRAIVGPAAVAVLRVTAIHRPPDQRPMVALDGAVDGVRIDDPRDRSGADVRRPSPGEQATAARLIGRPVRARQVPTVLFGPRRRLMATAATLPEDLQPGDLIAVPAAGAYHQPPADLSGRPPVIGVESGASRVLVRRETEAELFARDLELV